MNRKSVRNRGRFPGEVEIFFTPNTTSTSTSGGARAPKKKNIHTDLEKDSQLLYHVFSPKPPTSLEFCVFFVLFYDEKRELKITLIRFLLTPRTTFFPQPRGCTHSSSSLLFFSVLAAFIFTSSSCD